MNVIQLNQHTFESAVLHSEKPVLVDFWAEWCGPCKMLNPVLNEIAAGAGGSLTVAKINVDEAPEIAARYRIQSIPTLLVIKNGREESRLVGVATKKTILERLALN